MPTLESTALWNKPWIRVLAGALLVLAGVATALRLMDAAKLPQAQFTTLAGQTTNLRALAGGKPLVVNLWATWCPPCRLELPFLADAQFREPGIVFVFVDQGEDATTVTRYLRSAQLDLDNVMLDIGGGLGREIGATGLPVTLFYDANGRMADSHLGALSPSLLADKLERLRPPARQSATR